MKINSINDYETAIERLLDIKKTLSDILNKSIDQKSFLKKDVSIELVLDLKEEASTLSTSLKDFLSNKLIVSKES